MIYFTSDWHVGHENVLRLDKRPYTSLDRMHSDLIRQWNERVKPDDIGFFLGDMGLCSGDQLGAVIRSLNGTKILIRGNHDKGTQAMLGAGFDLVLNTASISVGKTVVTMSHCPLRGLWREDTSAMKGAAPGENWHGESRHLALSLPDTGGFHLHGHTHKGPDERTLGRQWDVGVRANNYMPVSLSQVESWIARYPTMS